MEYMFFPFSGKRRFILRLKGPKKLVEFRKAVVKYVMQANKNLTGTENQSELFFPTQHRRCKLSINR